MLVKTSGEIVGTVGGGRLEADVIACAKQVLNDCTTRLHHFDLTGSSAMQTDMICGGVGDVFVYCSTLHDAQVLDNMLLTESLDGWICYPTDAREGISYWPDSGPSLGAFILDQEMMASLKEKDAALVEKAGQRYLIQRLTTQGKLHIMGAGHVSMEIAKIAYLVGMDYVVYDDRQEFLTSDRFPHIKCALLKDMAYPPEMTLGIKDMIAIVTRGHSYDMQNLAWALKTGAGYIGMIGSARKGAMIFDALINKGYQKSRLTSVHTPIGLDIGAQTPQEIAVAIVAELIGYKHGKIQ